LNSFTRSLKIATLLILEGKRLASREPARRELVRHRRDGFVSDELWTRKGLAKPRGYDPETREIDAVISTGMAVRRRDWDGEFDEVLGMKPGNVRLARLNQGAAVLDTCLGQGRVGNARRRCSRIGAAGKRIVARAD
jgi:hypothetical protein